MSVDAISGISNYINALVAKPGGMYARYAGYQMPGTSDNAKKTEKSTEITEEEKKEVQNLSSRDREVRTHENAHVAAGGRYVQGGPSFEFQTGPDGKKYAVGGEVQIDTSAVRGDPEATLQKMAQVRKAALAPANPSGQDRAIAAQASAIAAQARQELSSGKTNSTGAAAADAEKPIEKTHSYSSSGQKMLQTDVPSSPLFLNIYA